MNTTQCNKIDALLNFDIPKKDQQPRAHLLNVTYIDPAHIMMSRIYPLTTKNDAGIEISKHYFAAKDETEMIREGVFDTVQEYPVTFIDRKRLLAALNAMDCDVIKIRMQQETPLFITGMMDDEVMVESVIAPRIYDGENEVHYYDQYLKKR